MSGLFAGARPDYRPSEALLFTTRADSESRITALSESGLQILYTLVMALKATAWRGVLIAQFRDYFDATLLGRAGWVYAKK